MFNTIKVKLLVVFILVISIYNVNAQSIVLQTIVTANFNDVTLKEALQFLETKYKLNFFYSDDLISGHGLINAEFDSETLESCLTLIFSNAPISFKMIDDKIVLFYHENEKQQFSVSGTVCDAKNGESLIGVTIYELTQNVIAITNSFGYYSLKLKQSKCHLQVSYVGYQKIDTLININNNVLINLLMRTSELVLNEVSVVENLHESKLNTTEMSTSTLYLRDIRNLTGMFGENDVVQNLTILPGIQQGDISDGGVYVRGGSSDQTVFLMDEATIYNPSHFGGLFSVFNPDIINTVEIFKGDMPVTDNGAISSSVNVHLREGNNKQWKAKGSVGLLSVKGLVEGPVKKDKSSVLVAFRRSYIDLLLWLPNYSLEPDLSYYFYDLNLKYNLKINNKNRLFLSAYSGSDHLDLLTTLDRANQMVNFRWNHIYAANIFSNTSAVFSRNHLKQKNEEPYTAIYWQRHIFDMLLKHDLTFYVWQNSTLKTGISFNGININPYEVEIYTNSKQVNNERGEDEYLLVSSLYASINFSFNNGFSFNSGIRINHNYNPRAYLHNQPGSTVQDGTAENPKHKIYSNLALEPRINLKYSLMPMLALKTGFNRQVNGLHQLQVTESAIAANRWMPATNGFKPQLSNNYTFGVYSDVSKSISAEIECYYRAMDNLIETFHNEHLLVASNPDKYLFAAKGKAIGLETMVNFKYEKFSAFLNYTYSDAKWQTLGVNQNNWYPAYHDRPHSINISGSCQASKRVRLAATWVFSSGAPYTKVIGKYSIDGKPMVNFDSDNINTERLPNYHRLDLSIDIAGKKNDLHRWNSYWNFSLYNAYFHKNPMSIIYFTTDQAESVVKYELNPKYYYLFQFIPSVTYKFEF
jgi:hypothetical protein